MLISLNWLKDFVDFPKNLKPQELGDLMTLKTAEVDSVQDESEQFENMVTGHVLEVKKHPDADKLKVATVSVGKENLQIVCGGENLREGMYVVVTKVGSKVRWHGEGDLITLEKTKIRGVESYGMIAAGSEIGIDDPNAGTKDIMDVSKDKPKPGTPLAEFFQKDDTILEIDNKSLTHRPDLWGHYGFAREVAAITDSKLKPYQPAIKIPAKGQSPKVEIEDYHLCPRYCGLIINNIKVAQSPAWLKKRLNAVGHGTHNNIVDITNYVMSELGQPMHAFDQDQIEKGIVVRRAKKNEKITTLDKKDRTLSEDMLVIADHKKALALAGIMGGENSEINEQTTSIILESANFNAGNVRRTSSKLGLRTNALQRFEKSLDPRLAEVAIKRAAELILEICPGAEIAGPITDIKDPKLNFDTTHPLTLELDTEKARTKIGVEIDNKEIKKILESLEFKVEEKAKNKFKIQVPSFRATKDVDIEDDLIEEIARVYGYDNIPALLPNLPARLPEENRERFYKHRSRELLSFGLNFDEVCNYSFYSKTDLENCLLDEKIHLKVLNYLSEDQTHMRISLVPNLLKNLQKNLKNFEEIRIYEIGHTYKEIDQYFPLEEKRITGAVLTKKKSADPFYECKGAVEMIFQRFNLPQMKAVAEIEKTPYAHPHKGLTYIDPHGQTIAKVFMLHPVVAKNHELDKYSVAFFSINFTELMKLEKVAQKYQQIPKFPGIDIDVSVLIDNRTHVSKLEEAIQKADENLITAIELFDIYEGENIEKNKKAVAFKITLQALDRTLTDQEMATIQQKIFTNLEKLGGKIRGK